MAISYVIAYAKSASHRDINKNQDLKHERLTIISIWVSWNEMWCIVWFLHRAEHSLFCVFHPLCLSYSYHLISVGPSISQKAFHRLLKPWSLVLPVLTNLIWCDSTKCAIVNLTQQCIDNRLLSRHSTSMYGFHVWVGLQHVNTTSVY